MSQLGCHQFGVEVYAQGSCCQSGLVIRVVSRMWKFHWAAWSWGHVTLGCSPYKDWHSPQEWIPKLCGSKIWHVPSWRFPVCRKWTEYECPRLVSQHGRSAWPEGVESTALWWWDRACSISWRFPVCWEQCRYKFPRLLNHLGRFAWLEEVDSTAL